MQFPKMISLSGAAVVASLLFLSALTSRATTSPGQNSGPPASGEGSLPVSTGKLDFQTDLFSGRFGYSVPIVTPPARNGSEPSLALHYNSTGDNGWCGQGWELETGYIQRETRNGVPVKWSSGLPLNEYEDGKGFVFSLNGASSRLINVATNQFRAEIESGFLKFNYLTNSGGNSWLVTDTSGNKFYFGETADSRMVNTKWGSNTNLPKGTFRWALNRSVTVTGTTNQFTYQIISGAQYPKLINYNGHASSITANNQIEFELKSTNHSLTWDQSLEREGKTARRALDWNCGPIFVRGRFFGNRSSKPTPRAFARNNNSQSGTLRRCNSRLARESLLTLQPRSWSLVANSACDQPFFTRHRRT
ncbi:hypothetical protein GC207_15840 [bacterium]|nr:hypothetical protein [bacterium]